MGNMKAEVVDAKGVFLKGDMEDQEEIHMKISQGREHHYNDNEVIRLKAGLYGLKQAVMAFWRQLLVCMKDIDMSKSTTDPYLCFNWTED